MTAPVARRSPRPRTMFGDTVVDDYAWLRDRDDPDTLRYLESENAHTARALAPLEALRDEIFSEIVARTQESDLSAPARRGPWFYATRTEEGRQYPVFVRMKEAPDGPEEVLLDANDLAEGHDYLALGVFEVSPDHRLLAYGYDTTGREDFTIRIRDLTTGEHLPDVITGAYYTAAWSSDSRTLFSTTFDAAHRPHRVWRHVVGADPGSDVVVFEEDDQHMFLTLATTKDERYLLIRAESQVTEDMHVLEADRPDGVFRPLIPRVHGVRYRADHRHGRWLVVTDADAPNGRLISLDPERPEDAVTLIEHDPRRKVAGVTAFARHVMVSGRSEGRTSLTVLTDDAPPHDLTFDEEVYTVGLGVNHEYDTDVVRIDYQSLTTPRQIVDVDLITGARTIVKETPVLGGFDRTAYLAERQWVVAPDGERVPISLVRRRDASSPAPLLLYGYGSYESCVDPYFSIPRLSLLDRGVTFAIAHPRGGGTMGRLWYEDGKLGKKMNTFTDFVAAAQHLVETGRTTPDHLAIRGASAGGLLMGAVVNLRPDLFRAVVAEVPFVDVVNTMLDESLPLTVIEWEEWGNPKIEEQYRWMRAYAPYENLDPSQEYPAMYVSAGLNDPRVSYWEPAKWVAAMRSRLTHRGPLVFKTELGAGHGGKSGRYDAWRDEAEVLAFVLDQIG